MRKALFIIILTIISLLSINISIFAQPGNSGWKGSKYHYGTYYADPSEKCYGERKVIRDERDARKVLLRHFKHNREVIGNIKDRNLFFEVEIRGRDNKTIDRIIIDKRTGRIRSVY
ncbi:MAG: hypothetical protein ACPL1G_06620 [Thermodesulfovibrionales bacterium]